MSTPKNTLKRTLSTRHLNMIAIGGSIGTGLFVATGASIASSGPGGTLLAYALIGVMVYFLMTSLGEMAAYMPVAGSFSTYGSKFVESGFGFALGWNYWFNWAVTIAAELVAAQLVMKFWFPDTPGIYWSGVFLAIIFLLNFVSVRCFGESEFWFALIKVLVVIVFIIIGLATIFGLMHGIESPGFKNFTTGDAPFAGGFQALVGVVMIAGFSFQGTEIVGVAAAESQNPSKNVPIAVRQVFWRITLFYILAIFVIGALIPYTDPSLLRNETTDISVSPFTLLFERAGFASAAALMNAVILTAILSAGNSGMYASTRMLHSLAEQGKAPKIFAKISRNGVPRNALYATTLIGALCFLTSVFGDKFIYNALLNTSGMCGFIAWLGIAVSHYRFRKGFLAQGGRLEELPYRATLFPFGPLFAFSLCMIIVLGQNYSAFIGEHIDWSGLVATYISLPLFLAVWIGYRIKHGTRLVKYNEMDVEGNRVDEPLPLQAHLQLSHR